MRWARRSIRFSWGLVLGLLVALALAPAAAWADIEPQAPRTESQEAGDRG